MMIIIIIIIIITIIKICSNYRSKQLVVKVTNEVGEVVPSVFCLNLKFIKRPPNVQKLHFQLLFLPTRLQTVSDPTDLGWIHVVSYL